MADDRPVWRRAASSALGFAIDRGWLTYRPMRRHNTQFWDQEYAKRVPDYYRNLSEAARYGTLLGYLRALGDDISILDVGCGEGILRERLDGLSFSSFVGIDVSEVAIERARALEDGRTRFVASNDVRAHGRFDVVVCNEMLYYPDDVGAFLDDVIEVLLPGGHLLTSVFRHRGHRGLRRMIDERFERRDAVECRNLVFPKSFVISCHRRPAAPSEFVSQAG